MTNSSSRVEGSDCAGLSGVPLMIAKVDSLLDQAVQAGLLHDDVRAAHSALPADQRDSAKDVFAELVRRGKLTRLPGHAHCQRQDEGALPRQLHRAGTARPGRHGHGSALATP